MADYGCVLARLQTTKTFDKIKELIDPADCAKDGVEKETHVTLLYGLHDTVTTAQVRKVLDGMDVREIEIVGMSLFENPDADVLKLDVRPSKVLRDMNQALEAQLPNSNKFPDYVPHVTIAYLKPGTGKKYLPSKKFKYRMKVSEFVYSYPGRTKQEMIYESVRKRIILK